MTIPLEQAVHHHVLLHEAIVRHGRQSCPARSPETSFLADHDATPLANNHPTTAVSVDEVSARSGHHRSRPTSRHFSKDRRDVVVSTRFNCIGFRKSIFQLEAVNADDERVPRDHVRIGIIIQFATPCHVLLRRLHSIRFPSESPVMSMECRRRSRPRSDLAVGDITHQDAERYRSPSIFPSSILKPDLGCAWLQCRRSPTVIAEIVWPAQIEVHPVHTDHKSPRRAVDKVAVEHRVLRDHVAAHDVRRLRRPRRTTSPPARRRNHSTAPAPIIAPCRSSGTRCGPGLAE